MSVNGEGQEPARPRRHLWRATLGLTLAVNTAGAQETIYNVVLGKAAPGGELFTTNQLTIDQREVMSDSYVVYGLGWEADVGLGLLNLDVGRGSDGRLKLDRVAPGGAEPLAPVVAASLFKRFSLHEVVGVALSTQLGLGLTEPGRRSLTELSSADLTLQWPGRDHRLVAGVYHASQGRVGEHAGWGLWTGAELAVFEKKVHLDVEFISGRHALSNLIVGPKFFLTDDVDLAFGLVVPAPRSDHGYAGVVQFEVENLLGRAR